MDVDGTYEQQAELITLFDLEPESFPWGPPIPASIEERRMKMSDLLIFDILLASGGVQYPSSLYPPTDPASLQRLLGAIENSSYDTLKQDCLIYYLLKWHRDDREFDFMEERCIPPQFAALADAYWHLDSGIDVAKAVALLSDVRINKEHTSKIMQALSLSDDPSPLIRNYIRTAKPLLTEPDDINAYTLALAESSLLEAWQYQRSFAETSERREKLFRKVLDWCFSPRPRVKPLKDLLAFPLSSYEEKLLQSYALDPPLYVPASSLPALHDLVCLRLIQAGQYATAIKLERQLSAANPSKAGDANLKATQDRRQMMDDIMVTMPIPERQLLEIELEQLAHGKGAGIPSLPASRSSRPSLNMSWESVRTPTAVNGVSGTISASATRKSALINGSPIPSISQRSGAPRFGGPLPAANSPSGHSDIFPPLSFSTSGARAPVASTSTAPPLFASSISASQASNNLSNVGPSAFQLSSVNRFAQSTARANSNGARTGSLFDSVGSANQLPNAFYQPSASAGAKRPFASNTVFTPSSSARATAQVLEDPSLSRVEDMLDGDDIDMDADDSHVYNGHAEVAALDENTRRNDVPAEFSVSVFSPPRNTSGNRTNAAPMRTEPENQTLPGAFGPTSDDESEPMSPPIRRTRKSQAAPPPRSPSPPPRRTPRTRKNIKERDLGRSLPGTLMTEDEGEEEEDTLAPLPPPTPATRRGSRKTRTSRGGNQDEMTEAELRPRRSTRLSTVGSSSPEPPSPQKPSAKPRGTRKSTAGSTAPSKSTAKRGR